MVVENTPMAVKQNLQLATRSLTSFIRLRIFFRFRVKPS